MANAVREFIMPITTLTEKLEELSKKVKRLEQKDSEIKGELWYLKRKVSLTSEK